MSRKILGEYRPSFGAKRTKAGIFAWVSLSLVSCATREVSRDEPSRSPASPQAKSVAWAPGVKVLDDDPPLPGEPAWAGLEEPAAATKPGAQQEGVNYVCPMHADVVSDHPGTCPRCHMTLERRP